MAAPRIRHPLFWLVARATDKELSPADVVCHESLSGLLKHYERRAA